MSIMESEEDLIVKKSNRYLSQSKSRRRSKEPECHQAKPKLSKLAMVNMLGLIDVSHISIQIALTQDLDVGIAMCKKALARL